jgi:hypothetical protein
MRETWSRGKILDWEGACAVYSIQNDFCFAAIIVKDRKEHPPGTTDVDKARIWLPGRKTRSPVNKMRSYFYLGVGDFENIEPNKEKWS